MIVFGHRKCFGMYRVRIGVPGGYRNPLGVDMGHRREAHQPTKGWRAPRKGGHAPPWPVRIGQGRGRPPPLSFSLRPPSLSLPLLERKGTPTRIGNPSWTPLWHAPPLAGLLLPSPLYTWAGGTAKHNRQSLSRVRCPPPHFNTSAISS